MVRLQSFNNRIKAWVIFDFVKGKGFKVLNVKQRNPTVKFKGVKVSPKSSRKR